MNPPTITPDTLDFANKVSHWVATGEWPERRTDIPVCQPPQSDSETKEQLNAPR